MSKIIGLLSYFEEEPEGLERSISCAIDVGVDYLIAADGPYDLFEADSQSSSAACKAAIMKTTMERGVGLTMLPKTWRGNEVEKRNHMLEYAFECVVEPGDWFLVFDSDHYWWHSDYNLKANLDATTRDFAEVSFADGTLNGEPNWYEATLLMRAIPGMIYAGAHWRVELPSGRTNATLRAGRGPTQVDVLDLRGRFHVWHGIYGRDAERLARQSAYYHKRDTEGVES